MKHLALYLQAAMHLSCAATTLAAALTASATGFPIASGGRPVPVLYVAPTVPEEAAADLGRVLGAITGASLIRAATPPAEPAIVVGDKSFPPFAGRYDGLTGMDTVQIAVVGNQLHLVGSTAEAASHAVYTFLDDLGCRWYMPGPQGEALPSDRDLTWNAAPRIEQPSFHFREIWWAYGGPRETADDFRRWKLRNRLGSRRIAHGHNLTNTVPPETYLREHPEYYALVDGARIPSQLCTSNPDVIQCTIETINDYFDRYPEATSYSLCPDDNQDFCECPNCTALDIGKFQEASQGGYPILTDRLMAYLNAVAQGIQAKHPGHLVSTYAYQNYSTPPEREPVDAHVAVVFTTSMYCSAHSIGEPACASRQAMKRDLEGWARACQHVYIYEYDPTPYNAELPWPMYGSHARAAAVYRDLGIGGFSYESHDSWASLFPNHYVAARMMWDADANYLHLLDELCARFYGPAASPMRNYFLAMDEALRKFPEMVPWGQKDYPDLFPPDHMERCLRYIEAAEQAAPMGVAHTRVHMSALGFHFLDAYLTCRRAASGGVSFADYNAARQRCEDLVTEIYAINRDYIMAEVARDYLDRQLGQVVSTYFAEDLGLINDWMLIGPFDNANKAGHTKAYPPESVVDFNAVYNGKDHVEVRWFPHQGAADEGIIDLTRLFTPTEFTTIYAVCYVTSPKAQLVQLRIGSNDSVKAWLNDTLVLDSPLSRTVNMDDDRLDVMLPVGVSRVLLKVSNTGRAWGYCLRITDQQGNKIQGLKVTLSPDEN